jgi:hypothetical protein
MDPKTYIEPERKNMEALLALPEDEELLMLNLLRYRDRVEQTGTSGTTAFREYMKAAFPFLRRAKAEVVFFGKPQTMLIGPQDEALWDDVLIVKYPSPGSFLNMVKAEGYPLELRRQSLQDSRLIYCKSNTARL